MNKFIIIIAIVFSGTLMQAQKSLALIKANNDFTGVVRFETSPYKSLDLKQNSKLFAKAVLTIDPNTQKSYYYLVLSAVAFNKDIGCTGKDNGSAVLKFNDNSVIELKEMGETDCNLIIPMVYLISEEEYQIILTKELVMVKIQGSEGSREIRIRKTDQLLNIFNSLSFNQEL